MKKILAFVLTLSLLTTFFAVPAFAKGEGMSIENGQTILSDDYLIKDDDTIEYYTFYSNGSITVTSSGGEIEEECNTNKVASKLEKDFENFDKVVYYPFEKEAEVYYKDGKYEKSVIIIKSEGIVIIDYLSV